VRGGDGQIAELKEKLAQEKLYLEDEIRTDANFEEIVGKSPAEIVIATLSHSNCHIRPHKFRVSAALGAAWGCVGLRGGQ